MKIVISGASNGIGKACAEKFLREGHEVVGIDIEPSKIEHPAYRHFQLDIASGTLPEVEAEILVASHGTPDEDKALEVNFKSVVRLVEHFRKSQELKSVLLIASASARNGAEFPFYSASKGALVTHMKHMASVLAPRGITVNSVSPGAVITSFNEHILEEKKLFEAVANESLLKKWATPGEIAEWVYFLTVVNKSMTGEDLLIDNGEMLKSNFIW